MLYSLTKKERKAVNDAMEYGCMLGLTFLIYIGGFALRVFIGICIAFVLCMVCDWANLDVDPTMLWTIVIALAGVSILFPSREGKE